MSRSPRVAVVGATGVVGQVMLDLLAERGLDGAVTALASERSAGSRVACGDRELDVGSLVDFDFAGIDYALFSAGAAVSEVHAPRAASAGAFVIDNTSAFRCRAGIPLAVPEVNGDVLEGLSPGAIIANPNCSTIQLVVAVAPLHRAWGIERINVATYQSASGAGREALEALGRQLREVGATGDPAPFAQPLGLNVLAAIDRFDDNGYTREEMKMHHETRWILDDSQLSVNATAVRVPVAVGHSEAVHLVMRDQFELEDVLDRLATAPGVRLVSAADAAAVPSPLKHAAGDDAVWVGRVRRDHGHPRGLDMWVVSDNLRKGAALNAIQVLEHVHGSGNHQQAAKRSA